MIEQYTITTTPKYNFPQPKPENLLSNRLTELSINSLRQIGDKSSLQNTQLENTNTECPTKMLLKRQPIKISPRHQETIIAAVDTSTIKIGETKTGIIIAIRGAIVYKENKNYRYTRFGPFIFHITENNKKTVYNNIERAYFNIHYANLHHSAPTLIQMPNRIASLFERWLQATLSKQIENGIILFDGSLTSGTLDTPVQRLREILNTARRNKNTVLAFSKATSLRTNGYLITDLLPNREPPYLLETTGIKSKPPTVILGDVFVARLNKANMAFRLDIDKETPTSDKIEAVEKLVGNDVFQQSYPETLRLSHILCTFTANEVLAMKHFITRKHRIQIINRPDMHRLLFGPFSKGDIYA